MDFLCYCSACIKAREERKLFSRPSFGKRYETALAIVRGLIEAACIVFLILVFPRLMGWN